MSFLKEVPEVSSSKDQNEFLGRPEKSSSEGQNESFEEVPKGNSSEGQKGISET